MDHFTTCLCDFIVCGLFHWDVACTKIVERPCEVSICFLRELSLSVAAANCTISQANIFLCSGLESLHDLPKIFGRVCCATAINLHERISLQCLHPCRHIVHCTRHLANLPHCVRIPLDTNHVVTLPYPLRLAHFKAEISHCTRNCGCNDCCPRLSPLVHGRGNRVEGEFTQHGLTPCRGSDEIDESFQESSLVQVHACPVVAQVDVGDKDNWPSFVTSFAVQVHSVIRVGHSRGKGTNICTSCCNTIGTWVRQRLHGHRGRQPIARLVLEGDLREASLVTMTSIQVANGIWRAGDVRNHSW
mmetsp:Transcript_135661/g.234755  ORF Transcript_135661/g.234755 Transcript_135661/m.234755 type:complete len:302 (-) Transcript_135661:709-1614(-)